MAVEKYWEPYVPSRKQPWNQERVEHLHHRLGFAATPDELQRDLEAGFYKSLDRFHSAERIDVASRLVPQASKLVRQAVDGNRIRLLKAAWVMQMWHGADPLTEQLCLMWHNHFATSFLKVRDCNALWQQNQSFRQLGRGRFGDLLSAMLTDRAMLVWLDASTNRAEHPNENLARELLELFTLGVDHYTERDVQETARALTGWRVDESDVRFDEREHDAGTKTILGSTAEHNLESLLGMLVDHPATARRLALRLCDHFLGGDVPPPAIDQLAQHLREHDLTIQVAIDKIIRSERFFADAELHQRVRSPVSFVVGGVRSLELHRTTDKRQAVSPEVAASWTAAMGQDLFQPPGVSGWQGGTAWLGTSAMIQRAAFVHALSEGRLTGTTAGHEKALQLATSHVD